MACLASNNLHKQREEEERHFHPTNTLSNEGLVNGCTGQVTDGWGAGVTVSIAPIQLNVDVRFEHCVDDIN